MKKPNQNQSKTSYVVILSWLIITLWCCFLVYISFSGSIQKSALETQEQKIQIKDTKSSIESIHELPNETINPETLHVVFSTDCELFQDWQTLLIFHSAEVVKQPGPLTRIASGCDNNKKVILTNLYKKLHPNYHVHFTPDFKTDAKTNKSYNFYNKPYGVQHWLEHANPPIKSGEIVAVVDPDFIFLRPLTTKMNGQINNIVSGQVKITEIFEHVAQGKPVAQHYGLGAPWVNDNHKKFNRTFVCGEGSPCLKLKDEFLGGKYYSVGPPYILEKNDWIHLTNAWTKFVPRVYEIYPFLLAEMYAYSMAAAHEELPHLRMDHFMVSNTDCGGEGWPWVDALGDDVCEPPVDGIYYPGKPLPTFLHYCQGYTSGSFGFYKRRVSKQIFSCDSPMLMDPPNSLGNVKDIQIVFDEKENIRGRLQYRRNAYMLCTIHRSLNAALLNYKLKMCQGVPSVNYEKTAVFS